MLEPREEYERIAGKLAEQRDELKVKLHLAKADAKDEWSRVEKKWGQLKNRLSLVQETAGDVSEDIGKALKQLAHEIEEGYGRIRRIL